MKKTTIPFPNLSVLLLFFACAMGLPTWGQCTLVPVLHTSGTQMVDCTDVTVTSDGNAFSANFPPCFYGPYTVGQTAPGSYTFTFSPPVTMARIDVETLNNNNGASEEMAVYINGGFYPMTTTGLADGCFDPLVISPSGTLMADVEKVGSAKEIIILENMTSLKVEDRWLSGTPAGFGFNLFICCVACETDAGEITAGPLELCPNDLASVPPATGTFLDSDDLMEYILFTDLADTLGSIIATSSTPEFAFDPATMQMGVTYYIAALAGDDLNGNVDLIDPCLDISNAIEVVWHIEPSVAFTANFAEVCADGCYDIEIYFIGTAPFHLQGEVVDADNTVVAIDEIYNGNFAVMTICLLEATPAGNLIIQATGLTDVNCECN